MQVSHVGYLKIRKDVEAIAAVAGIDKAKPWSEQNDKLQRACMKSLTKHSEKHWNYDTPMLLEIIQSVLQNTSRKAKVAVNKIMKEQGISVKRGRPRKTVT